MKILIYLGNDAANYSIEPIVRKLRSLHDVRIVVPGAYAKNTQMFCDIRKELIPESEGKAAALKWADCIFATPMVATKLQDVRKYVFCFCHMNPQLDEARGYDFVFTLSEIEDSDVPPYFAWMPVGLAKNDVPDALESSQTQSPKQLLYIDAGHFPFGTTGQRQIAEMLLKICAAYPDYTLCVRPRWQPGTAGGSMSNPNFTHLYDHLLDLSPDGLPRNLKLSRGNELLQQQIDESCCVISSCTSAYLDAALRGKPLLLISGFDNEDMYHLRDAYKEHLYQFAQGSGCVVDYRDVLNYLPNGLKCSEEHLDKAFSYRTGATDRVIEVMEYIYYNYIARKQYPSVRRYGYETYRKDLAQSDKTTFDELLINRRFCATETAIALTYKISSTLDFRPYYEQQKELCRRSLSEGAGELKNAANLRAAVEECKAHYLVEHGDCLINDVDYSYLYYAMYTLGMHSKLMEIYDRSSPRHDSLLYYAALIFLSLGQQSAASQCLEGYIEHAMSRTYPRYITDTMDKLGESFKTVLINLYNGQQFEAAAKYVELFNIYVNRCGKGNSYLSTSLCWKLKCGLIENGYEEQAALIAQWAKEPAPIKPKVSMLKRVLLKIRKPIITVMKKTRRVVRGAKKAAKRKIKNNIAAFKKTTLANKLRIVKTDLYRLIGKYSDDEKAVLSFRDTHCGESCFVIGNGPSLRAEDLEEISRQGYACFASNKIYKIFSLTDWRPDYYACFDKDVFTQNLYEILTYIKCPIFLNRIFRNTYEKYVEFFKQTPEVYFSRYVTQTKKVRFYPQAASIRSCGSVTAVLVTLAWMMGYRHIYLIGCDQDYSAYQNLSLDVKKITAGEDAAKDYFVSDYMRRGEKMNVGDLDRSNEGFAAAREYIEKHGGEIYNATRGGKLEVFKRVDLDELLTREPADLSADQTAVCD